jgi:tetratricopeptide (TPR) repeat protein
VLHTQALVVQEKTLGEQHPTTALVLNNLANLYFSTGVHSEAEPLFRRAIAIQKKMPDAVQAELAASLYNLADMYSEIGQYAEAEPLGRQALTIAGRVVSHSRR